MTRTEIELASLFKTFAPHQLVTSDLAYIRLTRTAGLQWNLILNMESSGHLLEILPEDHLGPCIHESKSFFHTTEHQFMSLKRPADAHKPTWFKGLLENKPATRKLMGVFTISESICARIRDET
ncbi:hypothetical protein AVEN_49903-1 [Araneus ventricosus]|uniref:Uncharacterized protein n=1 Tax=Araneus ventricosus TaxID=182803 RepID=A0A4Y2LRG1_ARAVE|nr:hypothetical protein AVEN_49903-1 [Araneus ventricosus]